MYIRIGLGFAPSFFTSKYSFSSGVGYVMRLVLLIMWTAFQSVILRDNNNANRCEREVGSYPENSIVGDSKDTKESTVPVRRRKRETWDPW